MLHLLGGNWQVVKDKERLTPKETPPVHKETPPVHKEIKNDDVSAEVMVTYLRAKKVKGAHLMKYSNLKKRYEAEKQKDG